MTEQTTTPATNAGDTVVVSLKDLQVLQWFASLMPTLESQLGRKIKYAKFEYDGGSVLKNIIYEDEVPPPADEPA